MANGNMNIMNECARMPILMLGLHSIPRNIRNAIVSA